MEGKYLPLGSVVLLEGGQKRLMITGYCMETPERPDKIFDYCGCIFPEGTIRSDLTCVFDHSQIEKIFSTGYTDDTSTEFLNKLKTKSFEVNPPKEEPQITQNSLITLSDENNGTLTMENEEKEDFILEDFPENND